PHRRRPGAAAHTRDGVGRDGFPDQAFQPQALVRASRRIGGSSAGRPCRGSLVTTWAVVLAGGIGSRFWPLSTPDRPKQLLPLVSREPLLRDTLDRLAPLAPLERMLVLTNASLTAPIASLVPDLPRENLIAEPKPAGTAAALTWA